MVYGCVLIEDKSYGLECNLLGVTMECKLKIPMGHVFREIVGPRTPTL